MLGENENIEEDRYHLIYNSRKEGKMGTLLGVRKDLENKYIVIEKVSEEYEATWIIFTNKNNINIRIGNIYAPQESRTKKTIIKKMYKNIKKHIEESKGNKEKIFITGDFNAKIGKCIKGNTSEVSKSGRLLLRLVKNEEMEILNRQEACEGKWTRIQGNKKSILDYVIVNKGDGSYVNKMVIDENKEKTPFHIVKGQTVYSDHCAIYINMNWLLASREKMEEKYKTMVNSKTLREFKKRTESGRLTKTAKSNLTIQDKYTMWNRNMKKLMEKCFIKKGKYRNKNSNIEKLYRKKRKLKMEYREKEKTQEVVRLYKIQRQLINEYIEEEEKKTVRDRITKNVNETRENGGINASTFWEFKKRMDWKTKKKKK